jgi:hypothetical protein
MAKVITAEDMKNETEEKKELVLIDLACGDNKYSDSLGKWIGVDIVKTDSVDIVHDLMSFPYPFESNSVDELNCSHFVEHIPQPCKCFNGGSDPWADFFNECFRIMKVGARMRITAPYYSSIRATQDYTHRRSISEASFMYLNKGWRDQNKLDHYEIKCDFDFSYSYAVNYPWSTRSEEARNFAIQHYQNVVSDIFVTLTKRG